MPDAPCLFRSTCYEVLTWHIIPHAAFLYNPENLLSYGGALKPDPSPMEKAGLSIPGEAAILGVDNDAALCENASPTLSSIRLHN
jgi:hypothetical protein